MKTKAKAQYYTPWSEPAPRSAVKGYRKLRKGEKLRATDKLWQSTTQRLVNTIFAGERVCAKQSTACHYYRRKTTKR